MGAKGGHERCCGWGDGVAAVAATTSAAAGVGRSWDPAADRDPGTAAAARILGSAEATAAKSDVGKQQVPVLYKTQMPVTLVP